MTVFLKFFVCNHELNYLYSPFQIALTKLDTRQGYLPKVPVEVEEDEVYDEINIMKPVYGFTSSQPLDYPTYVNIVKDDKVRTHVLFV